MSKHPLAQSTQWTETFQHVAQKKKHQSFDFIKNLPPIVVFDFDSTLSVTSTCYYVEKMLQASGFKSVDQLGEANDVPLAQILMPYGGAPEVEDIRRYFVNFFLELDRQGKMIAIATYGSKAVDLVFLRKIFQDNFVLSDIISETIDNEVSLFVLQDSETKRNVPVLIIDPLIVSKAYNMTPVWKLCSRSVRANKNDMLSLIRQYYERYLSSFGRPVKLNNSDIVLIDDDENNVFLAKEHGYQGVNVPPADFSVMTTFEKVEQEYQ